MSREEDLTKRIAYLEFINDQLQAEIRFVDQLLRSIGFPKGLDTVKTAASEIKSLEEDEEKLPE